MNDSKLDKFKADLEKRKKKLKAGGFGPKYMWDASSERVKFWMLSSIFPKNLISNSLADAVLAANQEGEYVLHIGCGQHGQALLDLENLGAKNLIGIDFNPPLSSSDNTEFVSLDLTQKLPIETGALKGVVFGSYLFHYMSPKEQYNLLMEIDRISGPGSQGFLGPFFPQHLENSMFSKRYPNYKNPLFGLVDERNKNQNEKWLLSRSRVASYASFSGISTNATSRKGFRIPLLSFYDMSLRSFAGKFLGNAKVKKDYRVHLPNEFFITFVK